MFIWCSGARGDTSIANLWMGCCGVVWYVWESSEGGDEFPFNSGAVDSMAWSEQQKRCCSQWWVTGSTSHNCRKRERVRAKWRTTVLVMREAVSDNLNKIMNSGDEEWTPEEKYLHKVMGHAEQDDRCEMCVRVRGKSKSQAVEMKALDKHEEMLKTKHLEFQRQFLICSNERKEDTRMAIKRMNKKFEEKRDVASPKGCGAERFCAAESHASAGGEGAKRAASFEFQRRRMDTQRDKQTLEIKREYTRKEKKTCVITCKLA